MTTALAMPTYIHELIIFALHPLNIIPHTDEGDVLVYKLEYASGLVLSITILCVEFPKYIFFKEQAVGIAISENSQRHLSKYVDLPKSENDITFTANFLATFAAMSRTVAEVLGAGECITIKERSTTS